MALLVVARGTSGSSLERWDHPFWDLAQRQLLAEPPITDGVTVVLVDDESLSRLGAQWPLNRGYWAQFLDAVSAYEPATVALDAWFENASSTEEIDLAEEVIERLQFTGLNEADGGTLMMGWLDREIARRNADARFVRSMAATSGVLLGVACPTFTKDTFQTVPPLVAPFAIADAEPEVACRRPVGSTPALAGGALGEAGLLALFDGDGTIRRYPFVFGTPQGPVAMLATGAALRVWPDRRDELLAQASTWAEHPPLLRYRPSADFTTIRFSDVIESHSSEGIDKEPLRQAFAGKAVLVGVSALGTEDARTTPLEADVPGVFVHANALSALQHGVALRTDPASQRLPMLLGLLVLLGLGLAGDRLTSGGAIVAAGTAVAGGWSALTVARLSAGHASPWAVVVFGVLAWMGTKLLYVYLRDQHARRQEAETRKAFSQYLAPAVVEQLMANPDQLRLGGERKVITAFFSDIAGFTTMSEQMDPAELSNLLNDALGGMTQIILEEGGTIDKYIGDAIVAMFGAPVEQPDHADRALRAAIRCQDWLANQHDRYRARGWPAIVNRIGLNTGAAIVGNMGSEQRFDYTMLGDTVNLAARLEGANKAFGTTILVGPETARMARRKDELRELDLLQVKGKTEGVRVFTWCADARTMERSWAALTAYRAQKWDEAVAAFESLGDDPTAAIFLRRIEGLRDDPPGPGWDGVYRLTTK